MISKIILMLLAAVPCFAQFHTWQPLMGGYQLGNLTNNATSYLPLFGGYSNKSPTVAAVSAPFVVPIGTTFMHFVVALGATPGAGTYTFSIVDNGVKQSLAVTVSSASLSTVPFAAADLSASDAFHANAGDLIYVECDVASSPNAVPVSWVLFSQPDTIGQTIIGGGLQGYTGTNSFAQLDGLGQASGTENQNYMVMPGTGTISNVWVSSNSTAPGAGITISLAVNDNGTSQITVTIPANTSCPGGNPTCTYSDPGMSSFSVAAGDLLDGAVTAAGGTPNTLTFSISAVFTPTVIGQFPISMSRTTPSTTTGEFTQVFGRGNISATVGPVQQIILGMQVQAIYAYVVTQPGGTANWKIGAAGYVVPPGNAAANQLGTVTITSSSNSACIGPDAGCGTLNTGSSPDYVQMATLIIPANNPASTLMHVSYRGYLPPAGSLNAAYMGTAPNDVPNTLGSTTFATIPNTAYTSPLGTSVTLCGLYGIAYASGGLNTPAANSTVLTFNPGNYIMGVIKPCGYANNTLQWILATNGGGGNSGYSEDSFGGPTGIAVNPGNKLAAVMQFIYSNIDQTNLQGGKGFGIILYAYPETAAPFGATLELTNQVQSADCAMSSVMSGILGFTPTAPLGLYGGSWGALMNIYLTDVATSVNGALSTCLYSDNRTVAVRSVMLSFVGSICQPNGSSSWQFGNGTTTMAFTATFDNGTTPTYAACLASDQAFASGTGASPYLQISNAANLTRINASQHFFQAIQTDQIVPPTWSGGGNLTDLTTAFTGLGGSFTGGLTYINYPCYTGLNGQPGHECGLGDVAVSMMADAAAFLLGQPLPSQIVPTVTVP